MRADAVDDDGDPIRIEVEARKVNVPFQGRVIAAGDGEVELVLEDGAHHWQVRAVDDLGAEGEWVSFGGNAEDAADVVVYAFFGGSAGSRAACLQSAAGSPSPWGMIVLIAAYRSRFRRVIR